MVERHIWRIARLPFPIPKSNYVPISLFKSPLSVLVFPVKLETYIRLSTKSSKDSNLKGADIITGALSELIHGRV
jgi:hypothetical protein